MVEIVLIICALCICFGIGYWFVVRPMRQLQVTVANLHGFYSATQNTLLQSQQAIDTLSRALRSPHQQGQWGELELRRIVEMSGMVQYCDFETQVSLPGIYSKQRLDLVIHLHSDRKIIVDAKVPIEAYLDAASATDDAVRAAKLKQHAQRVRAHIYDLAKREYWRHFQPSPEIVVLFLPNEATFRAALEQDPKLIDLSIQQNILLASPLTLIALLKTIAYGWSQENRAQSIQQIVNQSQTLHEELVNFSIYGNKHRGTLDETIKEFNQLAKAYNSNVLPVDKQLRALDSTLANNDKVLQVSPLSRKLEEFIQEQSETVPMNRDVDTPVISFEG